jgi:hypothetical protein
MRTVLEIVRPLVVAALACIAGEGCLAGTREVTPEESYYLKHQACVLYAQTLEDSKACRRAVDAEYGVTR